MQKSAKSLLISYYLCTFVPGNELKANKDRKNTARKRTNGFRAVL